MVAVQFGTTGDAEPGRGRERQLPIEALRLDMSARFDQEDGASGLERPGKLAEESSRVGQFMDHGEGEVHLAGEPRCATSARTHDISASP